MLTNKQQAVLEVVREYAAAHGYPPTVREIGSVLGLASSSTVHSHLAALERAGYLERDPSKPRALKLATDAAHGGVDLIAGAERYERDDIVAIPLVGSVAAGSPLLAEQSIEETIPVPVRLTRSGESFLLRIRGDSMIGAGILDDDYVVVRRQPDAANGEIVVALIEDEATCKRFFRRDGAIELHSENDAYAPIVPESCSVLGIVTGVMRSL